MGARAYQFKTTEDRVAFQEQLTLAFDLINHSKSRSPAPEPWFRCYPESLASKTVWEVHLGNPLTPKLKNPFNYADGCTEAILNMGLPQSLRSHH